MRERKTEDGSKLAEKDYWIRKGLLGFVKGLSVASGIDGTKHWIDLHFM